MILELDKSSEIAKLLKSAKHFEVRVGREMRGFYVHHVNDTGGHLIVQADTNPPKGKILEEPEEQASLF